MERLEVEPPVNRLTARRRVGKGLERREAKVPLPFHSTLYLSYCILEMKDRQVGIKSAIAQKARSKKVRAKCKGAF